MYLFETQAFCEEASWKFPPLDGLWASTIVAAPLHAARLQKPKWTGTRNALGA